VLAWRGSGGTGLREAAGDDWINGSRSGQAPRRAAPHGPSHDRTWRVGRRGHLPDYSAADPKAYLYSAAGGEGLHRAISGDARRPAPPPSAALGPVRVEVRGHRSPSRGAAPPLPNTLYSPSSGPLPVSSPTPWPKSSTTAMRWQMRASGGSGARTSSMRSASAKPHRSAYVATLP
jgi:hypothetical protein